MGLFSWFTRSKSADYETVLAQLASDISDAKQNLSEIRLRERRLRLLVNAYGVGLWAVWFGLWYFRGIPWSLVHWDNESTEAKVLGGAVVGALPVVLVLLNRFISWIFARKRTSEQTHLRLLLNKQRDQVEEIKKATNYDSTRKLIEQYEDYGTPQRRGQMGEGGMGMGGPPMTPVRGSPGTPTPNRRGGSVPGTPAAPGPAGTPHNTPATPERAAPAPGTPHAPGHFGGNTASPATPVPIPPGMTPEQAAVLQMQMQAITPVLPTPEKKWYDRLADTILGDDPVQSAQNKYALVCAECFRHNGLVGSKHEWERMQWICPRCNHMNPSPLSRMQAEGAAPSSSAAPAPAPTPTAPETPTKAPKSTARASPSASPLRRAVGERATRSSRLGKEVFSAADAHGGGEGEDDGDSASSDDKGDDAMEVDK